MNTIRKKSKLPRLLEKYRNSDFIIQQRARFLYFLCIASFLTTVFVLIKTVISQVTDSIDGHLNIPMLIIILVAALLFFLSLFLLIKGHYNYSVNIILSTALLVVWLALMHSEESYISKIDGIAYVFAVLSMVPLVINKGKYIPFLYSFFSAGALTWFILANEEVIGIHGRQLVDYLIDTSLAFFLISFVGYHVQSINNSAFERIVADIKKRQLAETALSKSEKKYKEISDLLPQIVAEIKLNGDITYLNKAGYEKFGVSEKNFKNGINMFSMLVEAEVLQTNIEKVLKGIHTGNHYTARTINGETFPVQIYSSAIIENGEPIGFRSIIIDISENIKAEEALIASERKYKEMLLLLPQTVYESDITGRITFMNKAGTEMFGYSEEDLIPGINVLDTIAPGDHVEAKANIEKLLAGEITLGYQYLGKRKDGSTFPLQIYSRPIIENNKAAGFRGVIFDLTQIKKVENELRQSNELFRALIELNPISTTLSDMNGRFLVVNKAFCNDLGIKPEDAIGKTIMDLGVKTEGEEDLAIINLLNEKGAVENFELLTTDKKGRKQVVYIYASIVSINNQKAMLWSNINVTEKKELENKLRESETLLRYIVDMVPYSILIFDYNRRLIFANRAYLERFNVALGSIEGKLDTELDYTVDTETSDRIFNDILENKKVLNTEVTVTDPNKGNIYTLLSYQPVTINAKPHYLITAVDITKLKLLENKLKEYNQQLELTVNERTEDLQEANKELKNRNKELSIQREELEMTLKQLKEIQGQLIQKEKMASLGILTAGVAHEVNNPLNYLMGSYVGLETYFQNHGSTDENKTEILLSSMKAGIERISAIVKGLNQFSRTNDSNEETCDIHAILENCLTMLHNKLKNKAEIIKEYNDSSIFVKGNVGRLHQAFINIISNAIQAIEYKGNITIKTDITGAKANIEIIDDGVGIDEEHLPKIYDPFFTTKAPGEGTGLGLSIAQAIIKEHSGELKFESEVNKGTKVILSFPLK